MKNWKYKGPDFTGQKIEMLTVIKLVVREYKSYGRFWWECECDCGKITYITTKQLKRKQKSCGCIIKSKQNQNIHWTGFGEISGTFLAQYKKHAESRNLEWLITKEFIWNLFLKQDRKCALTGLKLKFEDRNDLPATRTASLDRIDSSKGYTEDNVQWIHKDLQNMKWNKSEDDFLKLCYLIVEYMKKQGYYNEKEYSNRFD